MDKPAGLIVHSDGRTEEPSVAAWLLERYPALADVGEPWVSPQGERVPLAGIVHRLDRATSGALLVAKTREMWAYLKEEFKARRIAKTYHAYVYGEMEEKEETIIAELMRSSEPRRRWYARPTTLEDGRAAITDWKLLKNLKGTAYLQLHPQTGRTHQLRVHLASIGHPVIGDPLYAPGHPPASRMFLHASSLSFVLPSGLPQTFAAPLPPDFRERVEFGGV